MASQNTGVPPHVGSTVGMVNKVVTNLNSFERLDSNCEEDIKNNIVAKDDQREEIQ